jgi:predicted RNase H-like HicB family nuclease
MHKIPDYTLRLAWSEEDGGYIATCSEIPTLSAFGASAQRALSELQEAITGAIEILEGRNSPVPAARPLPRYSGQLRVRLPKSLHEGLATRAEEEDVSLNTLIVSYLSQGLTPARRTSSVTPPERVASGRNTRSRRSSATSPRDR